MRICEGCHLEIHPDAPLRIVPTETDDPAFWHTECRETRLYGKPVPKAPKPPKVPKPTAQPAPLEYTPTVHLPRMNPPRGFEDRPAVMFGRSLAAIPDEVTPDEQPCPQVAALHF